jgi:hypothetical protein
MLVICYLDGHYLATALTECFWSATFRYYLPIPALPSIAVAQFQTAEEHVTEENEWRLYGGKLAISTGPKWPNFACLHPVTPPSLACSKADIDELRFQTLAEIAFQIGIFPFASHCAIRCLSTLGSAVQPGQSCTL